MSELLDELARALAQPIPRRTAVRTMAVAAAVAAIPGLRPRSVFAGTAGTRRRAYTCNETIPWKCDCPSPAGGNYERCCMADEQCMCEERAAVCVPCKGHLCKPARRAGHPAPKGPGMCCPRGTRCTFNHKTSACCGIDQEPVKGGGACYCPHGKKCGTNCCEKGETCINGDCCPAPQTIGGVCCPEASATTAFVGGAKYCCPPNTVSVGQGCCPKDIPTCCDTAEETPPLPRAGYSYICVSGGWVAFKNP